MFKILDKDNIEFIYNKDKLTISNSIDIWE